MAKILVADDNPQLAEMLRVTLEEAGYEVITAYSGLAAAGLIEREDLDLVILDVLMPGVSGDAVAAQVQRLKPQLPVLLITGASGEPFVQTGELPLLRKPFTEQELVRVVHELTATP